MKLRPVSRLIPFLILAVYCVIQSLGGIAPFSHGDDQLEVAFVNGFNSFWQVFGTDVFELFRPVKNILFVLFSGLSTYGMAYCRLIAILVGVFSFASVLAFLRLILNDRRLALLAASIWLLAPTLVSSTAWLSCVNIQLMCAFVALAGICHLKDRHLWVMALLFLACCSYEQAVVIGPCLVLCDFFLRRERLRQRKTWLIYGGYALLTLTYLALRACVGSTHQVNGSIVGCSRLDLIWSSAYLTGLHFATWFWPFGRMAVFGGYANGDVSSWLIALCWALTAILFVVSWCFRNRNPALALGLVWAWVAFLPLGNLAGLRNGPYGDYYLGISSMGFAVSGVALLKGVRNEWSPTRIVWLGLAIGFLAIRVLAIGESFNWARAWATPELAYRATIRTFPKAYFAHITWARFLCDHGKYDEAWVECDAAEALMNGEKEKLATSHIVRALCAMMGKRNADEAMKWIDLADSEDLCGDNQRLCHFYRGCILEDLRSDLARAEVEYGLAIPRNEKWNLDAVRAVDRYARLLAMRGDLKKAIELWLQAIRIQPDNATIQHNLTSALKMAGCK